MKYSYVARQPILDKDKNTFGYELLFRDGPKNSFPDIKAELATSRLLSDHFLTTHYQVLGDKLGFVNFPQESLINRIPLLFPNDSLVVEVLEDCQPTAELLEAIKEISQSGYTVALDDFVPAPEWKPFLPYVSLIKFDIRIIPIAKASRFIEKLAGSNIQFIAEKIETYEEFQLAKESGFDYFQGYFFSKPELIQSRSIEPSFLTIVQLCKEVSTLPINFSTIEMLITGDVTLSYKLLRYVNSSSHVSVQIKSFRQALVYLGEDRIRQFVSLLAVASAHHDKPDSLYGLSIQRAHLCDSLSKVAFPHRDNGQAFLVGMFSLLDSLLDQPIEELLDTIALEDDIKQALIYRNGDFGHLLALSIAYEHADWDQVAALTQKMRIATSTLTQCYTDAVAWSETLLASS